MVRGSAWPSRRDEIGIADLRIHRDELTLFAEANKTRQIETAPKGAPVAKTASGGKDDAWKSLAKTRALEIIKRQRDKSLYPSQEAIADEIAKEFRAAGTVGAGGKPLLRARDARFGAATR